ncbi:hypothetical protein [Methylocystis sp. S23]
MSRFEIKPRLAEISGRAGALAREAAAPLQAAHLSPLSGMILAFLGAMSVGSALFAAYAIFGPAGSDTDVAAQDWTPPTLAVVELDPPKPASADVETLSRPIFIKSRRPAPKSAKPAASPELGPISAAPAGVVVGAIVKNKKTSQAFIVSPEAPEGAWRKIGDTVESWTLAAIDRAEIILKNGGQTAKVTLYPDPQMAVPEPAGLMPPPPPPPPVIRSE